MTRKFFVIGSVSQETKIREVSNFLKNNIKDSEIRHVKKEPLKSLEELITQAYNNIDWCDVVVVVPKENGKIGNGTLYEKTYAIRSGKQVMTINKDDIKKEQKPITLTDNNPLNFPSTPEPEVYKETFGGFKRVN